MEQSGGETNPTNHATAKKNKFSYAKLYHVQGTQHVKNVNQRSSQNLLFFRHLQIITQHIYGTTAVGRNADSEK